MTLPAELARVLVDGLPALDVFAVDACVAVRVQGGAVALAVGPAKGKPVLATLEPQDVDDLIEALVVARAAASSR